MSSHDTAYVDKEALLGRQILSTTAGYHASAAGVLTLIHVWLEVSGLGQIQCSCNRKGEDLDLALKQPHPGFEMPELAAAIEVRPGAPASVAQVVGAIVHGVASLLDEDLGCNVGFILETSSGSVAFVNIGDDLAVGEWPDAGRWSAARTVRG